MDDPASYIGEERLAREDALLRDLPDTGYAAGIRRERRGPFFQHSSEEIVAEDHEGNTPIMR